jgi:exonuclease VII large subunit
VADVTDQQAAALRDIAATKNKNSLELIKAMYDIFQGQQDVRRIIDNSKKIDPRDKAKLDSIIAGAGDFQEK